MTDKNSDYNKKHINLNDFLPSANRGDLLDSLNKNLFNRYLTKDEFDRIVGLIGDDNPNDSIHKPIPERTPFRQNNQLQPIVSQKIGSVDHYMGFEDFLTRIGRTGVDTERFDEWGNVLQFNWIPPIDLDKIVNYRDYYWDSNRNKDHAIPQYIVIKNKKNWANDRYNHSLKTIIDLVPPKTPIKYVEATKTVQFSGDVSGEYIVGNHLVILNEDGSTTLATIQDSEYKQFLGRTDVSLSGDILIQDNSSNFSVSSTELPIRSINGNTLTVDGSLSELFVEGYVLGLLGAGIVTLSEVVSSEFYPETNTTVVTMDDAVSTTTTQVSLYPIISLMAGELHFYENDGMLEFPQGTWSNDLIGTLVWGNYVTITDGDLGEVSTLGSNILVDTTRDFTAFDILPTSKLQILAGSKNEGTYEINSVSQTEITADSAQFFTTNQIKYKIFNDFGLKDLENPPVSPDIDDYWYDITDDSLKQFDGTAWVIKYVGLKLLTSLVEGRKVTDYSNNNDWSYDNEWVHKTTIKEFTGMIRAQLPIIEYFPFIELSETSYSTKSWRYRRNNGVSYVDVNDIEPKLFELLDIRYTGDDEFEFLDSHTIQFNQKYGNFVNDLLPGDQIRLQGFSLNDGIYTIASTDYVQPASNERFVSIITVESPLHDINDLDPTSFPKIMPVLTSMGDPYVGYEENHWEFAGIKDIEASSLNPEINPMLSVTIPSLSADDGTFEYLVGLNAQTYSLISGEYINPIFIFDQSLHDLVLYDDYQEGDIRVYVDGVRIYGAFEDLPSSINSDYVGGIQLVNNFTLTPSNVVRIELGEYAKSDIGKRAVILNTASGTELYNLTSIRKIEQKKSDNNQYPFFALRDIYGERLKIASSIFKYTESETSPINIQLLKRIVTDGIDYSFTQELKDVETGSLYCYYDHELPGDELQTIWKRGTNSEQYVPTKVDDQWEIPNQWYYNINHENYSEVKLTELFRHFKSIIDSQDQPGLFNKTAGLFWIDDSINYGLGGTIKEHNDGFDTLVSSVFSENGNPVTVIDFARRQYDAQVEYLEEKFYFNAHNLFNDNSVETVSDLTKNIVESVIDLIENNEKYDQWFGDSTSFINGVGVKNLIASAAQLGIVPRVRPYIVSDKTLDLLYVMAHDGHLIDVNFNMALKDQLIQKIAGTGKATYPPPYTPEHGEYSIENVTQTVGTKTKIVSRNLYRYDNFSSAWELVDVNLIFAQTILEIEKRLYSVLDDSSDYNNFAPIYDVEQNSTNSSYHDLIEIQFESYVREKGIMNPLLNTDKFRQNDPFTWNYFYTKITSDPKGLNTTYETKGSWQALYQTVFGTPYPHVEPWVLQGFNDKPEWWDYYYTDISGTRRWNSVMWDNIFDGIIPLDENTPSGTIGTGLPNQISNTFVYLPVNIDSLPTDDGYLPDELLPPYWNSINTSNSRIRGLFDPNSGEFVTTPHLNFEFGQMGPTEWEWSKSTSFIYDKMVVSYKLDPMRFLHKTFGVDYQIVSCLQISKETHKVFSHSDANFHGDYDTLSNGTYTYKGLNQWYVHYNRYNGYDGVSSEFRLRWRDWRTKLSYLFGAFIDTPSFSISNDLFDITTKDYQLGVKKTKAIDDKWMTSLTGTVLSIPSPYSRLRDSGLGWTVEFTNNAPVTTPIEYHPVQNYPVYYDNSTSTFRTYSHPIKNASIDPAKKYQIIEYNTPISLSSVSGLDNNLSYSVEIEIDDPDNPSTTMIMDILIDGVKTTFGDIIDSFNNAADNLVSLHVENGNLVLYRNNNAPTAHLNILTDTLFSNTDGYEQIIPTESTDNQFTNTFTVSGNVQQYFREGSKLIVSNSTHFDGIYTILKVLFDVNLAETVIFVEDVNITLPPDGVIEIDGFIEPENAKTLPDAWVDGTAIIFNTTGYTPRGIDDEIPYYLIRDSDRSFRIADTEAGAKNRIPLTNMGGDGQGELFVGKINSTFIALGGSASSYVWRIHEIDDRYIERTTRTSISGIQQIVDFIVGYSAMAETNGFFCKNPDGSNLDAETGRISNWQTVMEKFIDWLYRLRNYQQESTLEYTVSVDSVLDTLVMTTGSVPNWENGTQVLISASENSTPPTELNNPLSNVVPYYVIRTANNEGNGFRIAHTIYDAIHGNYIKFSDNGVGTLKVKIYKPLADYPEYELNPFRNNIWVANTLGIMSNILDDDFIDPAYAPRIYDNKLNKLTTADILVFREDKENKISLTLDLIDQNLGSTLVDSRHIAGMHVFFDGYEHIISFEDYSVDNTLIYDSFLGLNTPRFYAEFDRQINFTLRPNVGGFFINGTSLSQNFESLVNDMRYYYDSKSAPEGRITTDLVRRSLGYTGSSDYMNALNINSRTQFQFWQGMIQNKGTSKAVSAFVNQDTFDTAEVDEFWAYKVAEFGDNDGREYLEMNLFPDDAVKHDFRVEFITPDGASLGATFIPVKLTDVDRWRDQPDQVEKMAPAETFYFNAKVEKIIDNISDDIIVIGGRYLYRLDDYVDSVILHYYDSNDNRNKFLNEGFEYDFINSKLIEFYVNPATLTTELTLSRISVDYNSQNPTKIIDKTDGIVIAELPLWDPAAGHYYNTAYYPVDLKQPYDPAIYTNTIDGEWQSLSAWKNNQDGTVWFDSSIEQYLPYWDKKIYPDIDDRIEHWGKLAEWGDINLYQWTKTTVHPDEYDTLVEEEQYDSSLNNQNRHTGKVYKLLYENIAYSEEYPPEPPVWVKREDIHFDFINGIIDSNILTQLTFKTGKVYLNGKYHETVDFGDIISTVAYFNTFQFGTFGHVVIPAHVPTSEELNSGQYVYYTPHSTEVKIDPISGDSYNVYYYWVKDKREPFKEKSSVNLYNSKQQLVDMTAPYIILQGVRNPDFGYGLVFGNVFDEFYYNLPYRYTQMIVKGMHGTVKSEDRYVMRFTRDFSLRDSLEKDKLNPKNIHVEWKLFREKQLEKIDRYLWNRLTEALIGHKLNDDNSINYDQAIPSLDRILFDRIKSTDTRYGLGEGQVFTDKTMTLNTIIEVLKDPNQEFEFIRIEEFLENHPLDTIEDISAAMNEIYLSFSISEVNMIFFAALHDAMSLKKEYEEIFKTSWVALQITQNVVEPQITPYDELKLVAGPECHIVEQPTPSPTPTPSSTPVVTPTSTPLPTETMTPMPSASMPVTPTPDVTMTPTPSTTMPVTPTPSVTISVSSTPPVTATSTPSGTPAVTPTAEPTVTPTPTLPASPTPTSTPEEEVDNIWNVLISFPQNGDTDAD